MAATCLGLIGLDAFRVLWTVSGDRYVRARYTRRACPRQALECDARRDREIQRIDGRRDRNPNAVIRGRFDRPASGRAFGAHDDSASFGGTRPRANVVERLRRLARRQRHQRRNPAVRSRDQRSRPLVEMDEGHAQRGAHRRAIAFR